MMFCANAQAASITQYSNDEAGWLAAVSGMGLAVETETFDAASVADDVTAFTSSVIASYQSNYSGLSFVDDGSGDISVSDRVSTFQDTLPTFDGEGTLQTLIVLADDTYGFGADWTASGGTADLGVAVLMNATQVVGVIAPSASESFWGFVSDMAFDRVLLTAQYVPNPTEAPRLNFLIDDVVVTDGVAAPPNPSYAPTPTSALAGLTLLGLVALRRRG